MRQVLQEGQVEQRVQYLVEGLFKTLRDGFEKSGHPQIPQGLDLVEDSEKFEVVFDINDDVPDVQQNLNIFRFDDEYEQHEKEYEVSYLVISENRYFEIGCHHLNSVREPDPLTYIAQELLYCISKPLSS